MGSVRDFLLLRDQPIQRFICVCALFATIAVSSPAISLETEPYDEGPYPVGTSNIRLNDDFSAFSDEEIHSYLSGHIKENGENIFLTDQLEYPQDAMVETGISSILSFNKYLQMQNLIPTRPSGNR